MNNPSVLEACYKKYMENITKWLPDGIIDVNLDLLHQLDLLHYHDNVQHEPGITRYFHVVESEDKLTLANDDFVVWIVPEKVDSTPITYTLIALNHNNQLQLELAFATSGVYNNSHLVLRLLERYLLEIQNTEDLLIRLKHSA